MKSKFFVSSLILSLIVTSGCDMLKPKDVYQLKDTWGADGNWGNKVAKDTKEKPVSHKENKVTTHKKPDTHKETVKTEVKHEEPAHKPKEIKKEPVEKETPETNQKEPVNKETKTGSAFDNDDYSVMPASGTDQKNINNAFYVKKKDGDNINFSVGAVSNLSASDLNAKFKETYLKQLKESFSKLEIISTKDESIKGQKAWALNYTFEKNGKKLQQKQVFLPHKNNTLVLNCIESVEAFSSCEKDFNAVSKDLKLK